MTSTTLIERSNVPGRKHAFLVGVDANGNAVEALVAADGSLSTSPLAGEKNIGTNNAYILARTGGNLSVISKTTAVTIGAGAAGDTRLDGITVIAALTGTCAITGFADSDGTAQTITFPAATVAGFKDFRGDVNSAGALTITCSNAADDNLVLVHWSPV